MILVCPECKTRYVVEASLFALGPRQVRCAKCKHGWKAELPNDIDVVAPPPLEPDPIPETVAPVPEGSNLPTVTEKVPKFYFKLNLTKTQRLATMLTCAVVLVLLVVFRQPVVNRWAFMEPIYTFAGLYVYHPGDELEFQQVRSELKYDGGVTKLVLSGKIKNKTKKSQTVPNIVADAIGPDGVAIQSWQIDAPTARLDPEAEASFTSAINAPQGTVVNVLMNFAEAKE
jgi:predicted Zn finger-like uncharacterized protein